MIQRSLLEATPAELRETALIAGAVAAGFVVVLVAANLIAKRRGGPFTFWAIMLGSLGAALLGTSLYLDSRPPLDGVVVSKSDRIRYTDRGPEQQFLVEVQYRPAGAGESRTVELAADPEILDRYEDGDAIAVHHADFGGVWEFARLADRTTVRVLRSVAAVAVYPALIIVGVLATWRSALRRRRVRWILPGLVLTTLAVLAVFTLARLPTLLPLRGPQASAIATVRAVNELTETTRGSRTSPPTMPLAQPVALVEVEFIPEGRRATVIALDAVDAGSLVAEVGDEVGLTYRTDRPRTIRLTQGSRAFAWKNLIPLWVSLAVLAPLAVLGVTDRRLRRWLRR